MNLCPTNATKLLGHLFFFLWISFLGRPVFGADFDQCKMALSEILEQKLLLDKSDIDSIVDLASAEQTAPLQFFSDLVAKLPDPYVTGQNKKGWQKLFVKPYQILASQRWASQKEKTIIVDTLKYLLSTNFEKVRASGNKIDATVVEKLGYQLLFHLHLDSLKVYAKTESFNRWVFRVATTSQISKKWYDYMDPAQRRSLREEMLQLIEHSKPKLEAARAAMQEAAAKMGGMSVEESTTFIEKQFISNEISDSMARMETLRSKSPIKKLLRHRQIKSLQSYVNLLNGINKPSILKKIRRGALFLPKLGLEYAPYTLMITVSWWLSYHAYYNTLKYNYLPDLSRPTPTSVEFFEASDIVKLNFKEPSKQEVDKDLQKVMSEPSSTIE